MTGLGFMDIQAKTILVPSSLRDLISDDKQKKMTYLCTLTASGSRSINAKKMLACESCFKAGETNFGDTKFFKKRIPVW
jgi:hypothetical protein